MLPLSEIVISQLTVIERIERSLFTEGISDKSETNRLLIKLKSMLYLYRKPFDHSELSRFIDAVINEFQLNRNEIGEVPDYFPKPKNFLNLTEAINLQEKQILKSEIPFHFNVAYCLLNKNYERFFGLNHWHHYHSDEDYVYKHHFRFHGDEEDFKGAIEIFDSIIDADRNLYAPYLFKAMSNFHLRNDLDQVWSDLRRAKYLTSKQYIVNNALAYCSFNIGRIEEAYRILEDTVRKWPNYAITYLNLGILKMDDSPYDEAIEYFKRAMRYNSEISADAQYLIALQYLKKNQSKYLDLAIDYLINARNIDASHYEAEFLRLECENSKGIISLFNTWVKVTKYNYRELRRGFYNT